MIQRFLVAATLAIAAWPAAAQAPLKLPTTQGEIRSLLRETSDPMCVRCGVVTSVRRLRGGSPGGRRRAVRLCRNSALDTVSRCGAGARAHTPSAKALRNKPAGRYGGRALRRRWPSGLGNDPRLRRAPRQARGDHKSAIPG
jgi:hypothetical protein